MATLENKEGNYVAATNPSTGSPGGNPDAVETWSLTVTAPGRNPP